MMDFVEEIQNYSPHTGSAKPANTYGVDPQPVKPVPFASPQLNISKPQEQILDQKQSEENTGCTRFCKQKYYEQYFKVTQKDVLERIISSIMPPFNDQFIDRVKPQPDFYGPFWILTTIVFLLGTVGNFANYFLSKFSSDQYFQGYFFKLELVRYAVIMVYSFGVGVPVTLYFMFKFMKCNELHFPQIACLYGYSMSCYIPALLLCILPLGLLQWTLMVYAFANSSFFLFISIRKHILGLKAKFVVIFGVLGAMQLIFFLCCKIIFITRGN